MSGLIRERRSLRGLWRDRSAVVIIEFAYSLPLLMLLSFTSIEVGSLAVSNMRVSQIAMTVADNLSRAKQTVPLGLPELREVDINDALLGARIQGGSTLKILDKGRIVVSSLQMDASNKQKIFWQRCKGMKVASSAYGQEGATEGTTPGFSGMGTGANKVTAPAGSAIIFAEVNYDYEPVVGSWAISNVTLKKEAAFFVRDDRKTTGGPDNNGVFNPNPTATKSACNVYNNTFS